jgi:flavin-binding protein dodecin
VGRESTGHEEKAMTIAKVSEITSTSTKSFEDAVQQGVKRATKTLKNLTSAWVADQEVMVENGKITAYRVRLRVTFILER